MLVERQAEQHDGDIGGEERSQPGSKTSITLTSDGIPLRSPLLPPMVLSQLLFVWLVGIVCGYNKNTFYASNSAHRAKLPTNAPILPASPTYIKDLLRQINYTHYVWINSNEYSAPIYYVSATQPTSVVTIRQGNPSLQSRCNAVPVPSNAVQARGTDSSIVFYQASTNSIWEFWQFRRDATSGALSASWDMPNVSINPGFFKNPHPNYGVSGTSIGFAGGVMSIADAQAGVFPYALRLSLQDHARTLFVPPAMRTDGNGLSMIPEGTRFRLPFNFNVSTIPNAFARVIATALRDYGMITADTSGGVVLYAEDTTQYGTNLWPTIWGDQYPSHVLQYIPWNLMQVVDPIWQPWNRNNSWYQAGGSTGPKSWNLMSSVPIYTDSLSSSWLDYSWATVNFASTAYKHSGASAIQVTHTGSNAVYFHSKALIDTSAYNAISMWVYAQGSNNDLTQAELASIIQVVKVDGTAVDGQVKLGSFFSNGMPSTWKQIYVFFTEMGWTEGTAIQGFWIQAQMPISGSTTLYLDDINLVKLNPVN